METTVGRERSDELEGVQVFHCRLVERCRAVDDVVQLYHSTHRLSLQKVILEGQHEDEHIPASVYDVRGSMIGRPS